MRGKGSREGGVEGGGGLGLGYVGTDGGLLQTQKIFFIYISHYDIRFGFLMATARCCNK